MTATTTDTKQETNGTPTSTTASPSTAMVPASAEPEGDGRAISAFSSESNFSGAQRIAKALAASTLVPKEYQNNIPNVLIAIELASRIGASVFMVMQNLDIIHGRPAWRSQFLIATVNACGRFTPIRFKWEGKQGTKEWGCRAYARDRDTGDECIGSLITMAMADAEGWSKKSGSKWLTMPEQMLMYRAAAFWVRVNAPEISLGMQTREEVSDTLGYDVSAVPATMAPGDPKALEAELLGRTPPPIASPTAETEPAPPPTTDQAKPSLAAKSASQPQRNMRKPEPAIDTSDGEPADIPRGREPGDD